LLATARTLLPLFLTNNRIKYAGTRFELPV
jgi:hypothetical protein